MKNIILGITGSIAAYKTCDIINRLKKKGYNVICVITEEAEEFITPLTLETLSGNKVYKDMFKLPDKRDTIHVSLAKKADLIVISPATANIIAKLASGICDDLLTSVVISSKSPVLIAPAMNDNMYKHKITQKNIQELKKIGYKFIDPTVGHLACGYVGVGHLADLNQIIKRIEKALK
ncbi:MAG: phosphopantothenoylcysteine decarboxylase [Candidatus Omnitrophica bacterium]|nr:phosphopantothenoylcysteine decarboxylase [Candidatus Omnitrophota bacterium]